MIDKERYRKVKEIFNAALALEESERDAYLLRSCEGDAPLLEDVLRMLASHQQADTSWLIAVKETVAEQVSAYKRGNSQLMERPSAEILQTERMSESSATKNPWRFPAQSKISPKRLIATATALIFAAIAALMGLSYFRSVIGEKRVEGVVVPSEPQRSLTYWGELRRYQNSKMIGDPIRLSGGITGETYFNEGDGLRFFITPSDDGYLYLINQESKPGQGIAYTILFPSPEANGGSSRVNRQQQAATSECVFDANTGTERVWIIWSAREIEELNRSVKKWANVEAGGQIKDPSEIEFISRFIAERSAAKIAAEYYDADESIKLRCRGDLLIYSLKLKHR